MRYHLDQVGRAIRARHMTESVAAQLWIATVAVLLGIKSMLAPRGRLGLPVRLPTGRRMTVFDISEMRVLHEIFVDRIYDFPHLPHSARVIVDLGANTGAASQFFAHRFPGARIFAYEPDPIVADRARRNLRGLPVQVHTAAVSDTSEPVQLHRSPGMSWATSAHHRDGDPFMAPGMTLDSIIGEQHVDILKLDIEGSEYAAVRACSRLAAIDMILGEFHPVDGVTAGDFFALLCDFELISGGLEERATFAARRLDHPS